MDVASCRKKNEFGSGSPQYSGTNGSHSPNASHAPSNTPTSMKHKSFIAPPIKLKSIDSIVGSIVGLDKSGI